MPKPFDARAFERELVDAGYMPMSEYVRRWGDEALSSRAPQSDGKTINIDPKRWFNRPVINLDTCDWTELPRPGDNTRKRADD